MSTLRPVDTDHHNMAGDKLIHQEWDEVQRQFIAPVKILQDENERFSFSECEEYVPHSQHGLMSYLLSA